MLKIDHIYFMSHGVLVIEISSQSHYQHLNLQISIRFHDVRAKLRHNEVFDIVMH